MFENDHYFTTYRYDQGGVGRRNQEGICFLVDLLPISLGWVRIIFGMDWLSPFGDMIDCEYQLLRLQTPSGVEPIIHGEGA